MKPYSKDLRIRVLAAVDRGMPRGEVAETFGVSEPTVRRCRRRSRATPTSPSRSTASSSTTSKAWRSPSPASAAPSGVWGCRSKKVPPGRRARRGRKGALARGAKAPRSRALGVRGRVWDAHLHDPPDVQGAQGPEGLRTRFPNTRQEHPGIAEPDETGY